MELTAEESHVLIQLLNLAQKHPNADVQVARAVVHFTDKINAANQKQNERSVQKEPKDGTESGQA